MKIPHRQYSCETRERKAVENFSYMNIYVYILDARWGAEAPHLARVSDLRPQISELRAEDLRAKDLRAEDLRAKDIRPPS